jgi:hypothetical protein
VAKLIPVARLQFSRPGLSRSTYLLFEARLYLDI